MKAKHIEQFITAANRFLEEQKENNEVTYLVGQKVKELGELLRNREIDELNIEFIDLALQERGAFENKVAELQKELQQKINEIKEATTYDVVVSYIDTNDISYDLFLASKGILWE